MSVSPNSKVIHALNLNKAPGYGLITGKVLKKLPKKAIMLITSIFNAILRTGSFPSQ
jgi:uncharacterized protein Usg